MLGAQFWKMDSTVSGKLNPDEFDDSILGFIFFRYLNEKMSIFVDEILNQDNTKFTDIKP